MRKRQSHVDIWGWEGEHPRKRKSMCKGHETRISLAYLYDTKVNMFGADCKKGRVDLGKVWRTGCANSSSDLYLILFVGKSHSEFKEGTVVCWTVLTQNICWNPNCRYLYIFGNRVFADITKLRSYWISIDCQI